MPSIARDLRMKIIGKLESGISIGDIVKETSVDRTTVWRIKKRYEETGGWERKAGSGRPRKTTKAKDHRLYHLAKRHRKITSAQLNNLWSNKCAVYVSGRTVRRLNEKGLRGCVAKKRPLISDDNKKNRLQWALEFQHRDDDDGDKVLWSDECTFNLIQSSRRTYNVHVCLEGKRRRV